MLEHVIPEGFHDEDSCLCSFLRLVGDPNLGVGGKKFIWNRTEKQYVALPMIDRQVRQAQREDARDVEMRFKLPHATAKSDICPASRPQPTGSEEEIRPSSVGEISTFLKNEKRFQILQDHLLSRRGAVSSGTYKPPCLKVLEQRAGSGVFERVRPRDPVECNTLAIVEALLELAVSLDEKLRLEAAGHSHTPLPVLCALSTDPCCEVRGKVAENNRTPMHILETLSNDPVLEVAFRAKRRIQAELLRSAGCIAAETPLPQADPVAALKEALYKAS